jgi:hypothetical protein
MHLKWAPTTTVVLFKKNWLLPLATDLDGQKHPTRGETFTDQQACEEAGPD